MEPSSPSPSAPARQAGQEEHEDQTKQEPQELERFQPIQGEPFAGRLLGIEADGTVRVAIGDEVRSLALPELLAITRPGVPRPPVPPALPPAAVWLRSGVELPATLVAGQGAAARFRTEPANEPIVLQLRHLRAVRFAGELAPNDAVFARALTDPPARDDLLFAWLDGRVVRQSAEVRGVRGTALEVHWGGKDHLLPIDRVYGVVFGQQQGTAPDPLRGVIVSADLASGEVRRGAVQALDEDVLRLAMPEGVVLVLPFAAVARLRVHSDKLTWLSELPPTAVEQVPAFDRTWPWLQDRAPGGDGIRLGGRLYHRGLVLIPRTRLTWRLDGTHERFQAVVGIDERSAQPAHALLRVLADGKEIFASPPMTQTSTPIRIDLPIRDIEELVLEADFGERFDLGDHCAFADARLLK